jgi:hypothetical protein
MSITNRQAQAISFIVAALILSCVAIARCEELPDAPSVVSMPKPFIVAATPTDGDSGFRNLR